MSSGNIEPKMCWEKMNLVETFRLFRQQCELYLKVRRIPEEEWIDHILLLVGAEGLKIYNSWTFEDEEDKRKPEIIWQKFLEELEGLEPLTNFRVARFHLQKYTQRDDETIMDFLTRCKQQARKCNFRDERDTEEHLINLLIAGARYPELQQILLSKNKEMSLQEVIDISRGHEASINNMRKMGELQRKNEIQEIDAIKHKPIAFASKALTETEQRYANIERELLAVVFGCERFRTYIYGQPVEVESDHKPLEMISMKNLTAASPCLQRMMLRLQEYDLTVNYRPGKDMLLADGLSRLPNKNNKHLIDLDIKVDFYGLRNALLIWIGCLE